MCTAFKRLLSFFKYLLGLSANDLALCTRVVPKVPLHSLFCHNNSMSDITTLIVTKYYILGLWGQIFVLLRVFVKTQWRFEILYPYRVGAGLMTLPLIVIFLFISGYLDKEIYFKVRFILN